MIPNYKRPRYRDYILDVLECPPDDQDLDMITHIEELETIRLIYNTLKDFIDGETFRVGNALKELGNAPRAEYSGLLLGKSEVLRDLKWRIKDIESGHEVAKMFNTPIDFDTYNLVAIHKSEIERLRKIEENNTKGYNSVLYCPRNIETGEFVDMGYNPTDDITEAIGWKTPAEAKLDISHFDEPDNWKVVKKYIHEHVEEDNIC